VVQPSRLHGTVISAKKRATETVTLRFNKLKLEDKMHIVSRTPCWMLLAVLCSCIGCSNNSNRESLKQFLDVVEKSLGHPNDDKLRGYPEDERKIRWSALFYRDQTIAIEDYLATAPRLSKPAREKVEAVRQTCAQQAELFETLIDSKRYHLTEAEEKSTQDLRKEWKQLIEDIGRMIDGEK